MSRTQLIICLAALSLLFSGCTSEKPQSEDAEEANTEKVDLVETSEMPKYADAKEANEEYIDLVETYCANIDKAGSAEDAAKAVNTFVDGAEEFIPKLKKLLDKYPELKDEENVPEEWKASQEKTNEVSRKMMGAMMKLGPYMSDPAVLKAQERMGQLMTSFQQEASQ